MGVEAELVPIPSVVLAIGALPGDIGGGRGSALLKRREHGDGVLLLPLSVSTGDGDPSTGAHNRTAELMGARVIITEASVNDVGNPAEHQMLRELKPHTILIPSQADDNTERREAYRISRAASTMYRPCSPTKPRPRPLTSAPLDSSTSRRS